LPGIWFQVQAFFFTMVMGCFAALILNFYQILIRKAGVARWMLYFLDLLFWVLMVMLVFIGMLCINQGEMRYYVLIALISGGAVYYQTLSGRCAASLSRLAEGTIAGFALLTKVLYYFPRDIMYRVKKIAVIHRRKNEDEDEEK